MCSYTLLLLAAIIFVGWVLSGVGDEPDSMRSRLPTVVGAGLVLTSFATMPWVSFAPFRYMVHVGPELLREHVPGAVSFLLRLLGQAGGARLLSLISSIGFIPGWLLIVLMPSKGLVIRTVIFLVGFTGLISFLWFPASLFIRNASVRRGAGVIQALLGFLLAILLLLNMPAIDAWGTTGTFLPGLVTLVSGARMGFGVWVAWVGLLLVGIGGLFDALISSETPAVPKEELW